MNWHLIFLVSAPIGVFGTVWAYFMLHDIGVRKHAQMDWWGNLLFAAGLIAILVGITYGLLPYGGHPMGWTNPWVLTALFGGLALLVIFVYVETKVAEPLFRISLFRIRAFTAGNIASTTPAMGRGGMQFMLMSSGCRASGCRCTATIFSQTPLWAWIYLVPLTTGFLVAAPLSGVLSDKFGPKAFTVGGALLTGVSFLLLIFVPVNFAYRESRRHRLTGSAPACSFAELGGDDELGPPTGAGGWRHVATFQNSAFVLSIGIFSPLRWPACQANWRPCTAAGPRRASRPRRRADLGPSPIGVLFASFSATTWSSNCSARRCISCPRPTRPT